MHTLTDLQPYRGPRLHRFQFPKDTAIFAIGDVHGCSSKLRETLDVLSNIHTPHRKRVLLFLGDLVDRGPDTIGTLILASEAAEHYGFDEAIHLPGNHELLMRDALLHLLAGGGVRDEAAANWLHNGGKTALWEVYDDWEFAPKEAAQAFVDALPTWKGMPWLDMIAKAPSHLRVGDAVFVHAGISPVVALSDALGFAADEHLTYPVHAHHWAWIRRDFLEWTAGFAEQGPCPKGDTTTPGVLVVHGHTAPPEISQAWVEDPVRVLHGLSRIRQAARINLDAGSAQQKLVAGGVFTNEGWRLVVADGHR